MVGHAKQKRREELSSQRCLLSTPRIVAEVLLRGEPELDTAVFENDHERVGVTRVQIATVHVKLPVQSLHFGSALFAEKTGDRTVRGAFQFLLRNFLVQPILKRLL